MGHRTVRWDGVVIGQGEVKVQSLLGPTKKKVLSRVTEKGGSARVCFGTVGRKEEGHINKASQQCVRQSHT